MLKFYFMSIIIWFIILLSNLIVLSFVCKKRYKPDLKENMEGTLMFLAISCIPIFRFLIFITMFKVIKKEK